MEDKISALMDGELDNTDMADTISQIEEIDELRNKWKTYHLIGDALRQPLTSTLDIMPDMINKIDIEQPVLTPSLSNKENKGHAFIYAVAASIVSAVAVVIWMGGQTTMDQSFDLVADKGITPQAKIKSRIAKSIVAPSPVLVEDEEPKGEESALHDPAPTRLNDYMFAHEEFTSIRGVSPYMRTVASRPYK